MKKLLALLLLSPLAFAEPENYECTTGVYDDINFTIDKELESIKFINMVYKYDWIEHHNGYSAKSKLPKEPLHPSFTTINYQKVRWFEQNKVLIWTNYSKKEFVYICKTVT